MGNCGRGDYVGRGLRVDEIETNSRIDRGPDPETSTCPRFSECLGFGPEQFTGRETRYLTGEKSKNYLIRSPGKRFRMKVPCVCIAM